MNREYDLKFRMTVRFMWMFLRKYSRRYWRSTDFRLMEVSALSDKYFSPASPVVQWMFLCASPSVSTNDEVFSRGMIKISIEHIFRLNTKRPEQCSRECQSLTFPRFRTLHFTPVDQSTKTDLIYYKLWITWKFEKICCVEQNLSLQKRMIRKTCCMRNPLQRIQICVVGLSARSE